MATVTHRFRQRLLEGGKNALLDGVLCIEIVNIRTDKSVPIVTLKIGVLDPITNELLVEQDIVRAFPGDTIKLENLKKTFKIKLR